MENGRGRRHLKRIQKAQLFLKDLCKLQCFDAYAKYSEEVWHVELLLIRKMSSKARIIKKAQKQTEAKAIFPNPVLFVWYIDSTYGYYVLATANHELLVDYAHTATTVHGDVRQTHAYAP